MMRQNSMSNESEIELLKKALAREKKKVAHVEKLFEQKTFQLYQSNELLKKQQDTVIRAEKLLSIGRLAAGIAHEINNPLTFVSSNMEILDDHLQGKEPLDPEEVTEMITEIQEGIERIKGIVDRVNNFTRTENIERGEVDINQVVLSTVHLVKPRLTNQLSIDTKLIDVPVIFGNINELKQVILNLLINALDALDDIADGRPGQIIITSAYNERNKSVTLTIHDNADGMDKEVLASIFDPFFTTKELGTGSGLGLHVCHQIIEAHEGEIQVESIPDHGTVFTITLPVDLRSEPR